MQICRLCSGETKGYLKEVRDPLTAESFDIRFCPNCQIGITEPQPEELSRYYSDYYGRRHGATAQFRANRRLRFVESEIQINGPVGRLLDIGCGEGEFLSMAAQKGWDTVGVERDEAPVLDQHEVFESIEAVSANFGPRSIDAIVLWHSLEHVKRPDAVIEEARELLREDGRLFVAVPDAFGFQAKLFGKNWLHLDCPRHLFHFSRAGLLKMLRSKGFETKRSHSMEFEYDLLGWSQSALNALSSQPNIFFDFLRKKQVQTGRLRTIASIFAGSLFSVAALPLVLAGALLKSGGTIVIAASKSRSFREID